MSAPNNLSLNSLSLLVLFTLGLFCLYSVSSIVYNLHFHPLSKFNGPTIWCASRLGFISSLIRGNLVADVRKHHEKYGDIVRLAPNELSFAKGEAWHEVFSKRVGQKAFPKNPIFWKAPLDQPENMVTIPDDVAAARMRRVIAPGFTEQAVSEQEPIVKLYLDLLIQQLGNIVKKNQNDKQGAVVNIVEWYNFYTFDVIGDLGLGESFDSLKNSKYHPWVKMLFTFLKGMAIMAAARFYPTLECILLMLLPPKIRKMQRDHYNIACEKIQRRMNFEKQRSDFMTSVLSPSRNPSLSKMNMEEIESTFSILIIAGSETTATTLSGITNELIKAPQQLKRLVEEIRTSFSRSEDITFAALRDMPFLNAVCQEGLRICHPVPGGLPRLVPKGGAVVCGHFLPEFTNITVQSTAMSLSPKHFYKPLSFLPERFLPPNMRPKEFDSDERSTQYPFSLGPRSCIGKILAMAQLRIVLAKMVWHFDIESPGQKGALDWLSQKTYIVVQKQPVEVRLKLRSETEKM